MGDRDKDIKLGLRITFDTVKVRIKEGDRPFIVWSFSSYVANEKWTI